MSPHHCCGPKAISWAQLKLQNVQQPCAVPAWNNGRARRLPARPSILTPQIKKQIKKQRCRARRQQQHATAYQVTRALEGAQSCRPAARLPRNSAFARRPDGGAIRELSRIPCHLCSIGQRRLPLQTEPSGYVVLGSECKGSRARVDAQPGKAQAFAGPNRAHCAASAWDAGIPDLSWALARRWGASVEPLRPATGTVTRQAARAAMAAGACGERETDTTWSKGVARSDLWRLLGASPRSLPVVSERANSRCLDDDDVDAPISGRHTRLADSEISQRTSFSAPAARHPKGGSRYTNGRSGTERWIRGSSKAT